MHRFAPLLAFCLSAPALAAAPAPQPRPKLVVAIAVDQFSANLFEEWRPRFTGGLKRLSGGIAYPSGYHTHAATETCPGHSTLMTGRHPSKTGIVANTMRDEKTGKDIYCLADPTVAAAHDPAFAPVGPRNLMTDTLGEWMKARDPRTRVVSVSAKDRGAITMAGHNPDGVFWIAPGYGFTTYIRPNQDATAALAPVAALNRRLVPNWRTPPRWAYAHPECRAAAATWTVGDRTFESRLPPQGFGESDKPADIARNVLASPISDDMTREAARHLIRHFRLGQGPATDLLTVSFSATDLIGHVYGSRGPEMCEQMHRLDASIGALLADIDKLGIPYVVALTADHGGSDLLERLSAQGYETHRVPGREIFDRINAAVMADQRLPALPLTGGLEEMSLSPAVPAADRTRVLAAAKRAVEADPNVVAAFTLDELLATPIPVGKPADDISLRERFAESAYRGRSHDLTVALRAYSAGSVRPGTALAGHGSPWNYDRRVPILFWWKGAPAQTRFLPIETVDIAPTLAAVLGLTPPADVDGRCLPLGDFGAGACTPTAIRHGG